VSHSPRKRIPEVGCSLKLIWLWKVTRNRLETVSGGSEVNICRPDCNTHAAGSKRFNRGGSGDRDKEKATPKFIINRIGKVQPSSPRQREIALSFAPADWRIGLGAGRRYFRPNRIMKPSMRGRDINFSLFGPTIIFMRGVTSFRGNASGLWGTMWFNCCMIAGCP